MRKCFLLLIMAGFFVSCGTKKSVSGNELRHVNVKNVAKLHQESAPQFKTLYARLKGSYEDEYTSQSISITMRIKKDDTIWLSAKLAGLIPLAKALITPDRVLFYEKINQQYFDGDFSLLSKWLGTEMDFQKLQNLLIGQAIYPIHKGKYNLEDSTQGYLISSDEAGDISKLFLIDKTNFRLKKEEIKRYSTQQKATVEYSGAYQKVNHSLFPKAINIIAEQKGKTTKINIDYQSLRTNVSVSFPFKMPSGYKEIQL